jgi:two-component system sensor histidine kinase VicK
MSHNGLTQASFPFLGSSEMAEMIRAHDWSPSPIGMPSSWPVSLKVAVGNMLASSFPMHICCGENLIQLYNDSYLPVLGKERHPKALGCPIQETHKELWESIGSMYSGAMSGQPMQQTNFKMSLDRDGSWEDCYFDFCYSPIRDEDGRILGVLTHVTDTTSSLRELKEAKEESARERDNLKNIVMNARHGMAILQGPDFVVKLSNKEINTIWGKPPEKTVGRPILEIFPELESQPFPELLRKVYESGVGYNQEEQVLYINYDTGLAKKYVRFSYDPLLDNSGKVNGIMVSADDITTNVEARYLLEQSYEKLHVSNEQLITSNNDLLIANERLAEFNEELTSAQTDLRKTLTELEASESRFRSLVKAAPVCIAVLQGAGLIIETANDAILNLWNKKEDVIGKPILLATPELKDSHYLKILQDVFESGKPYKGIESRTIPGHNLTSEETYMDFIFQPILDLEGKCTSIIVVGVDVSGQVKTKQALQKAEEQHRFAINAANAGTWFMDIEAGTFIANDRLKEIFGYTKEGVVTFDMLLERIPKPYREGILSAVDKTIHQHIIYEMEHPIVAQQGQPEHWVRAMGRLYPDTNGRLTNFSGLMIDITEQKMEDMRKNDFISMVSHELKTPLTSLFGIVQLLRDKLQDNSDAFVAGASDKVIIQVKRMTNLINGFLNISRLESGKIQIEKTEFDLVELIASSIEEASSAAPSYSIRYEGIATAIVNADKGKIASVLSNLLSNATKYSSSEQVIEVACTKRQGTVLVSVKDRGIGLSPQDVKKIFDRYYRVEVSHTRFISGFGIGLYLSAEIVHHHGGQIWVESEPGKGSTFYFTLIETT